MKTCTHVLGTILKSTGLLALLTAFSDIPEACSSFRSGFELRDQ